MRRLHKSAGVNGTAVCTAAAALAFPPITGADVDLLWGDQFNNIPPEFDIEIKTSEASDLTLVKIYGASAETQVIADDDVDTVDFANNELDITTHGLQTGDGPIQLTTSDTLPTGLALLTDYYVIKKDAGTIQLALTRAGALAGTAVAFSDVGVGTHTIEDTATTARLAWKLYGLLGQAADGAISLAASEEYVQRIGHRARSVAYAITATISAGNVTAEIFPVVEV